MTFTAQFMPFSDSVYVSTSAQKYVMYRKSQNTCAMFVGFLYITYFCALVPTYTESENAIN